MGALVREKNWKWTSKDPVGLSNPNGLPLGAQHHGYHCGLEKMCLDTDIAVLSDGRLQEKKHKKVTQYKDLQIEIRQFWEKEATIIPIIVGALGASNIRGLYVSSNDYNWTTTKTNTAWNSTHFMKISLQFLVPCIGTTVFKQQSR